MSVLQSDKYIPIYIHPKYIDGFTRIKGKTDRAFMKHFFGDILDPLEYGMRLYLINNTIKPRKQSCSMKDIFILNHQRIIRGTYRVMSTDRFNSILNTVYNEIKEGMNHGKQRENCTEYSRAESVREYFNILGQCH